MTSKLYLINSEIPVDEDATHEFKGHRNLSQEEMPRFVLYDASGKATRQPLSKAICSFINSAKGSGLSMIQKQTKLIRRYVLGSKSDLNNDTFLIHTHSDDATLSLASK